MLRHHRPVSFLVVFILLSAGCIERKPELQTKQESPVTAELISMVQEHNDLRERGMSRAVINEADLRHRQTVYQLLTQALIVEAVDLYRASILLSSDDSAMCPEHVLLAYYLATEASQRGHQEARYLAAENLDKYLIANSLTQKYGTQITRDPAGQYILFPFDTLTSDSERAAWNVPPLDSLQAKANRLNAQRDLLEERTGHRPAPKKRPQESLNK